MFVEGTVTFAERAVTFVGKGGSVVGGHLRQLGLG